MDLFLLIHLIFFNFIFLCFKKIRWKMSQIKSHDISSEYSKTKKTQVGVESNFYQTTKKTTDNTRKTFSNLYIHKLQKKHFLLMNLIPLFSTLLALALIPFRPPTTIDLICLFFFWALTEFCIVAGYHRFFTHRSYRCNSSFKMFLHVGGLMAGQGGLISWVSLHRRHHECSDQEGDPHSPQYNIKKKSKLNTLRGILHAQFFWMKKHDYPNVMFYASELCRDKSITKIDQYYIHLVVVSILLPGAITFSFNQTADSFFFGVLWGGLVRLFFLNTSIGAVNSLLHTFGSRPFNTPDNSRNSSAFALLTFGDSYHNNHHAFPRSASAGLHKFSIDPAFWIIKALEKIHVTWDIYVPNKKRIIQYLEDQSNKRITNT
ncbi:MAG: acyl-CoA desaturase [Cellvibrionaceae bacterium]